ncbi:AAA-ATPase At3g28610 [Brachypodium distachyon]|uniref:AAA+ ATPase domain-containing protein n=1 Tax=Brachypodium distachyon TaxID=15368 RepID=A0A0Q3IDJ6_BRADI|nr:AAA-ATPase At3g28610 [Brachypodium distachyon]KQJ98547.1 hypothetical protein BRADI_3g37561v3 [Brachypodium distachyon]|eukprot:XP_010236721.1 AAA-ATPase At3g28610 [Brachypodium distachyon]
MQGDGSKMLSVGKMLALGALSRLRSSAWIYLAPVAAAFTPIGDLRGYLCRRLQLHRRVRRLLPFLDPFVTVDIAARRDNYAYSSSAGQIKSSDAYTEVLAYLSSVSSRDARQLRAEGAVEGDGFVFSLREGQEVADVFNGVTMWWSSATAAAAPGLHFHGSPHGPPCCRLTFHERHRSLVVDQYLPHVRRRGQEVLFGNRRRRLYTNRNGLNYGSRTNEVWSYIDFDHPTTFDTLAMDPAKKRAIMDDLDDFRNNGDYYHRIGKAWKRGYLLHGPPGTGKTTMIAAMANYLGYDIYDIELTTMHSNNDLRKLFVETTGRSIIVIEDIDCSLDLTGSRARATAGTTFQGWQGDGDLDAYGMRNTKTRDERGNIMTLSGLLNFIDGLWSVHSGERIIVFTTNHLDKLDPALIRRGRMDMHIEMSYCEFEAFKKLAENYLGVDAHPLFDAVRELLRAVEITPADVAECLITSKRSARDADACLGRLLDELKKKAGEKEEQNRVAVDDGTDAGESFCSAAEMIVNKV